MNIGTITDIVLAYALLICVFYTNGRNQKLLLAVWSGALICALFDIWGVYDIFVISKGVEPGAYYFLLSLTIACLLLLHAYTKSFNLYNLLNYLLMAQVVCWLVMFVDYRFAVYSSLSAYYYEISVSLYLMQLMAAINGDTNILTKLYRRTTGAYNAIISGSVCDKKEAAL